MSSWFPLITNCTFDISCFALLYETTMAHPRKYSLKTQTLISCIWTIFNHSVLYNLIMWSHLNRSFLWRLSIPQFVWIYNDSFFNESKKHYWHHTLLNLKQVLRNTYTIFQATRDQILISWQCLNRSKNQWTKYMCSPSFFIPPMTYTFTSCGYKIISYLLCTVYVIHTRYVHNFYRIPDMKQ